MLFLGDFMYDLGQDSPKNKEGDHAKEPYKKQFRDHVLFIKGAKLRKKYLFLWVLWVFQEKFLSLYPDN